MTSSIPLFSYITFFVQGINKCNDTVCLLNLGISKLRHSFKALLFLIQSLRRNTASVILLKQLFVFKNLLAMSDI